MIGNAVARAALVVGAASCGSQAVPAKSTGLEPADAGALGSTVIVGLPEAGALDAARGETSAGADAEKRLIARMLPQVSKARALGATREVPGVVLARDALLAQVREHVAREVPPEAIRQEGDVLALMGLIPSELDYEKETFALLEAQLAGFYEPADGTMYLAADLDEQNAEATLAHELVHALQDQHFNLKPHSKYVAGASDAQSAFSALAEGDATSAMADVLLAHAAADSGLDGAAQKKTALDLPDALFAEQVMASVSVGPAAKAPHVMRTSLVAPYVNGTLFVHALRRKGGWSAVDDAWQATPQTTEQILHVAKWEAREAALTVPAPPLTGLGDTFKTIDEDTYGELGLRLAFEEWMGEDDAALAASDWGGDRGVLAVHGDDEALALHVRYDAAKPRAGGADPNGRAARAAGAASYAARAVGLIVRGLEAHGLHATKKSDAFSCFERAEIGPLAIAREGDELVLVAGPATRVRGAPWHSAGTCAGAERWARAVIKTR